MFRHELIAESDDILDRFLVGDELDIGDGEIIRSCWEAAKFGNLICQILESKGLEPREYIGGIVRFPGFLSTFEKWHTTRVARKKVLAYRGCDRSEVETGFGVSWTLSKDVAGFFAWRCGKPDPVIVTAHIMVDAWLDTCENEIIKSGWVDADIVDVEIFEYISKYREMDWKNQPKLRPMHFLVNQEKRA